jgi:hypothetical protein
MEFTLKTTTIPMIRKYPSVPKIPEKIDAVHLKKFEDKTELRYIIVHKPKIYTSQDDVENVEVISTDLYEHYKAGSSNASP